jgi:hypothetical protein
LQLWGVATAQASRPLVPRKWGDVKGARLAIRGHVGLDTTAMYEEIPLVQKQHWHFEPIYRLALHIVIVGNICICNPSIPSKMLGRQQVKPPKEALENG